MSTSTASSKLNKKSEAKKNKASKDSEHLNEKTKDGGQDIFTFGYLKQEHWYKVMELEKAKYHRYANKEHVVKLRDIDDKNGPIGRYYLPGNKSVNMGKLAQFLKKDDAYIRCLGQEPCKNDSNRSYYLCEIECLGDDDEESADLDAIESTPTMESNSLKRTLEKLKGVNMKRQPWKNIKKLKKLSRKMKQAQKLEQTSR